MIKPGEFYSIRPDGKWEIYLDASMCSVFGVCEQMFKYAYVDSIVPKGVRPFARDLGSWWSVVMESIYNAEFNNNRLSAEEIVKLSMDKWNELKMDDLEKDSPKQYKEFGGRFGAIQMISEYASRQLPIDYQTWKIVAAEASFGRNKEVLIGETDRIALYWMGQPDLYVISGERLFPVDHKSVSHIDAFTSKKYKPNIQIPGYIVAGQILCKSLGYDLPVDRAVINVVARTDRTDKTGESKHPRFKRISVTYNPAELEEWKRRRLEQAERLRYCFENNFWQWNEQTCPSFYYRACSYLNIDEKPPEVRPIVIKSDYMTRERWIPGRTDKEEEKKGSVE